MPIDLSAPTLSGDGVIDLTGIGAFVSASAIVRAQGPIVRQPSSDTELLIGVGYLQFGFAADPPWSAVMYVPLELWVNDVHSWFDFTAYPFISAGWDKLKYHFSPGCVVDLWLTH